MASVSDSRLQVVMFADIVGSTALYERVGDAEARHLIGQRLAEGTQLVIQHNGRVVTEFGDEIMCLFAAPGDAADAACELHAASPAILDAAATTPRLRFRIGMHYGPFSGDKCDLSSETAKIARWAASNAKAEQTLATLAVVEALPRIFRSVSRHVDDETWNFISLEHVALYEIIWDVEAITAFPGEGSKPGTNGYSEVRLSLVGATLIVNAERPVISIGRGSQNDLVVPSELVSRNHLTAQFSRGRCTLTDKSTNGTLVVPDGAAPQELRHDTMLLQGAGIIMPGDPDEVPIEFAIRYICS